MITCEWLLPKVTKAERIENFIYDFRDGVYIQVFSVEGIVSSKVASTCNPATQRQEDQNSVGSNPLKGIYRERVEQGELNF